LSQAFWRQIANRHVEHVGSHCIVQFDDAESRALIDRKAAVQVADDAPLSAATSSDEYLNTPEPVLLGDGTRLEQDSAGRWGRVAHPGRSK